MRPTEPRSFDNLKVIDPDDEGLLADLARHYSMEPDELRDVIAKVGPNRTAVELMLAAPKG